MTNLAYRIWIARAAAVVADLVQVAAAPVSVEGVFSPIADGLDLVMAALLTLLVGWHISFIPSFLVKLLPVADLAPTWTIAVLVATRGRLPNADTTDSASMPWLPNQPRIEEWQPWRLWYDALAKPSWTPSPATIGLIWTVLYPLIALSFAWVFVETFRQKIAWLVALPFAVNLLANLLFTPILFKLKSLQLATLDILIVLTTLAWAMAVIWPISHLIAIAQVPYLIWICIATVLQVRITAINRPLSP